LVFVYQRDCDAGYKAHYDAANHALVRVRYSTSYTFLGVPYCLPVLATGALPTVILGHKTLTMTQVYAEKNVETVRRVMAEGG
jgi:hypothetical protein